MAIEIRKFGCLEDGRQAYLYLLKKQNMEVGLTDYGARLVSVKLPGADGVVRDIVLGYDNVRGYEKDKYCLGATIGRNANRIENAQFVLNGIQYRLSRNENNNNSHSGPDGYQSRLWETTETGPSSVTFRLNSPHMDQGFPGAFTVYTTYTLTDDNGILIQYRGASTADTVVNMTHHSYFNLSGHDSGPILDQYLQINASEYSPIGDSQCIPTGKHEKVEGTPMDFRQLKRIGRDISMDFRQLLLAGDYNHSFLLDKEKNRLGHMAEAYSEESGIRLKAYTDLPAMQLYTGVYLDNVHGKEGCIYGSRSGFCLEAQYTPNAINEEKEEKPVLMAEEYYEKTILYRFYH